MDDKGQSSHAGEDFKGFDPAAFEAYVVKDPQSLAMNIARAAENLGKAATEWLGPRERGEIVDAIDPMTDMVKTLSRVIEYWMSEPQRTLEAQSLLMASYMGIWMSTLQRLSGTGGESEPEDLPKDKRFSDDDWRRNPFFALLRQVYLVTSTWAEKLVEKSEGLDEHTRAKATFYVKQLTSALSPANFALTNPEVYRQTVASNGSNLVEGMRILAEDISAGRGEWRLRQTDTTKFQLGVNVAVTPGKVIARSSVCEVIQYAPSTPKVFRRPLVIVPPWINKYYILDLGPQKSFIKWCVDQGHTVFVISWVNPDEQHALASWEDYIRDGVDFALDAVEQATGETEVNAIGYCVGGTLLSAALAYHAKRGDERVKSVTFFTTQVDFMHAGELKVFVDEEQIDALERQMNMTGYLAGSKMASAFNMLRASELIWPYVVSNYLKGQEPTAFDLLYWNSDSTRMTAANHAFYLRNCYLENRLSASEMVLFDQVLSLKDITVPVYSLATKEDHIAPARSVFRGCQFYGGEVTFVLSGSGHIAGVVNPPDRRKYQYWTNGPVKGELADWLAEATEHPGSWWPHWQAWMEARNDERVDAREPGGRALQPLCDAPGTYVMVRS
ncbi:alpha/beta hydrolase [Rhizobium sp. SSA_523]|uniref:PHA/PHB synthase family protein n=1 Tax=Rhizobium sp. SSA_523 TaxID=2952477 RepID=UPI00209031BD|nr:class I poly(R)-hydroxyalkanoic acid synthase [Rhizobium sp. SSA_523]MCO5734077.1 class I poly(R)-hydroxyalkanoic acid synthase [Rhizobium sp. SSA_523]WKC24715.1 class I poly(R)-hydroxyalkanoic acid synthase [Rhizobium sp. SSA_523]